MLLLGCSRDSEDSPKPSGERTHEPVPETAKDAPTGPFAKFDFAAASKRWQGAWVLAGGVSNTSVAWHVEGDQVTVAQASADASPTKLRFAVYSPCQVSTTDDAAGETTYLNFAFVGEQLHAGLGATGVVLGETTVVCDGGQIYVLDAAQCQRWSELFDDWSSEPAQCRIEGEGADRVFVVGETRLSFPSQSPLTLLEADMLDRRASWHADFSAAKAALAVAGAASSGGH